MRERGAYSGVITVVGLGPGPLKYLTREAESVLLDAPRVLFRYREHPVYEWLKSEGRNPVAMGNAYFIPGLDFTQMYEMFADFVMKEAERTGTACYAVPGNPGVFEDTVRILRERADVTVVAGLSFLDQIYAELGILPGDGLQIVLPRTHLKAGRFTTQLPMLVPQPIFDNSFAKVSKWLARDYPASHPVRIIYTPGMPDYSLRTTETTLGELPNVSTVGIFDASLYLNHG